MASQKIDLKIRSNQELQQSGVIQNKSTKSYQPAFRLWALRELPKGKQCLNNLQEQANKAQKTSESMQESLSNYWKQAGKARATSWSSLVISRSAKLLEP